MQLLNFIRQKTNEKPTIVCFHGFGRRQADEFIPLINYFTGYPIIIPSLYNLHDETDDDWTNWVSRAERCLDEIASQNKKIILIGFSMGGVIASYCASKANVEKLVLIAPAFEYVNLNNATDVITSLFDKKEVVVESSKYPEVPSRFTTTFTNVVSNCKKAAEDILIPTFIIHGTDDETIHCSSSRKIYKKIPSTDKTAIYIESGTHKILDGPCSKVALENIERFILK